MKYIISLIVFLQISAILKAQNCGFDSVVKNLDKLITLPPSLKNSNNIFKFNSDSLKREYSVMKQIFLDSNIVYPPIPGFYQTGDLEYDRETFLRMKKSIDPEYYKSISRNPYPKITNRNPQ
jgi:hypothetical protein